MNGEFLGQKIHVENLLKPSKASIDKMQNEIRKKMENIK